jgi:PKD repeat protein
MKITNLKILAFIALSTITLTMLIFPKISSQNLSILKENTSSTILTLTSEVNKEYYYLREIVNLTGFFTENGFPVTNGLIAVEVLNSKGEEFAYRTLTIGNPAEEWPLTITEISIQDLLGNPLAAVEVASTARLAIKIRNNVLNKLNLTLAFTIYDCTLIPLRSLAASLEIRGSSVETCYFTFYIPEWATPGKALVSVSAFTNNPKNIGLPYIPETTYIFDIVRNSQLGPSILPAAASYFTDSGYYELYFRMLPDRYARIGTYSIYVTGRVTLTAIASSSTTFIFLSYPCPPQAAFTYYPLEAYANMTVTFDASSSSAEGYNDTIIRCEWFFNDPNDPESIIYDGNFTNPPPLLANHTFEYGGTYYVSLNVTDNEGLWSYTIKPIVIQPEFGPTANFTWTPLLPIANQAILFNASITKLGWSAKTQRFSPIVRYIWNFSDNSQIVNITEPTVYHIFSQPGNYSVQLTVVDADNRFDSIIYNVEVLEETAKPWDVDGNGLVNMLDMYIVALHYGETPESPSWDPRTDIDKNNIINMIDLYIVAIHYGEDP